MKVIVVSGPTATGKTDLAIELAQKYGGEVMNFDSLLLYQEINIGTAKPTKEERKLVPHHMIDVRSISEPMNAADFAREAFPIVERLLSEKKIVYLVGGSGFYLQALLKGMYDSPTTPPEILKQSEELYEKDGIMPFRDILKTHDPKSFERYHQNDHYRIRRAVEHWWTTGTQLSQARTDKDEANLELEQPTVHNWDILHLHLDLTREEHAQLIQRRTDRMIQAGLIEEVQALLKRGFSGQEKPLQSIGYKESLDYISGVSSSLAETRERIIISTRQLAKSQRTWFKRDKFKRIFHPFEGRSEIFLQVEKFIKGLA